MYVADKTNYYLSHPDSFLPGMPEPVGNPGPIRTCQDIAKFGLCEYSNFVGSYGKVRTYGELASNSDWSIGLNEMHKICPESCKTDSLGAYPYGTPNPGEARVACGPGAVCVDKDRQRYGLPDVLDGVDYVWWSNWECECPKGAHTEVWSQEAQKMLTHTCIRGKPCVPG
eukprot:SAG31_NODE_9047_length_1343_cov_1.284566_2_plen_170_part_00